MIIAVHLDRAGPNKLVVNRVASIYAKGWQTVADMFGETPAYLNQEKSRVWTRTARNQFPGVRIPQIRLGPNTATPDHVVKAAAPPASPPSEPNKGEAGGAKPGGGKTSFSLVRPLFASPEVMELRSEKSKWRNPGEGREGFDPAEAEALVSRYYHPQPFVSIPKDAVLVPMPSTSGKNILPTLLAARISKDHGQSVFDQSVGYPTAVSEAKTKTSFWKKAADPVAYGPREGLEALKALNRPVVIVEDILNTGESWMAFADLLTEHGIKVVDVAALASADPHLTSAADMRQLAEKIAKGTGRPLAEVLPAVHTHFDGTFRPYFETASRAVANAHEAERLYGLITGAQSEGRGAGPTQRRIAQENGGLAEREGHSDAALKKPPGSGESTAPGQKPPADESGGTSFNLSATVVEGWINRQTPVKPPQVPLLLGRGEVALQREAQRVWSALPATVQTRDGKTVHIKHNKQGTEDVLLEHLTTSHRGSQTYVDAWRVFSLARIVDTIRNARFRFVAPNGNRIYIQRYTDDKNHYVIVDPGGIVTSQGTEAALWTQWLRKSAGDTYMTVERIEMISPASAQPVQGGAKGTTPTSPGQSNIAPGTPGKPGP